jgi:hypothetical protein
MRRVLAIAAVAAVSAVAARPARADGESAQPGSGGGDGAPPAQNRINFRLGGASSDNTGRPTFCLDVRIVAGLGVESCGTGQALIHNEPGREMAHFRATWTLLSKHTDRGTGKLRAGAGFAELQVGVDQVGFQFGSPDAPERGSVSGPEAVVQGQWLVPLGRGVEAIASFTAGAAAFARADELVIPQRAVQPFVAVEIGLGW